MSQTERGRLRDLQEEQHKRELEEALRNGNPGRADQLVNEGERRGYYGGGSGGLVLAIILMILSLIPAPIRAVFSFIFCVYFWAAVFHLAGTIACDSPVWNNLTCGRVAAFIPLIVGLIIIIKRSISFIPKNKTFLPGAIAVSALLYYYGEFHFGRFFLVTKDDLAYSMGLGFQGYFLLYIGYVKPLYLFFTDPEAVKYEIKDISRRLGIGATVIAWWIISVQNYFDLGGVMNALSSLLMACIAGLAVGGGIFLFLKYSYLSIYHTIGSSIGLVIPKKTINKQER